MSTKILVIDGFELVFNADSKEVRVWIKSKSSPADLTLTMTKPQAATLGDVFKAISK